MCLSLLSVCVVWVFRACYVCVVCCACCARCVLCVVCCVPCLLRCVCVVCCACSGCVVYMYVCMCVCMYVVYVCIFCNLNTTSAFILRAPEGLERRLCSRCTLLMQQWRPPDALAQTRRTGASLVLEVCRRPPWRELRSTFGGPMRPCQLMQLWLRTNVSLEGRCDPAN